MCRRATTRESDVLTWKEDNVLTDLKDGSVLSEQGNGAEAAKVSGEW